METFQDNRIIAGYNNNEEVGFVNIETIAVDGIYFGPVDDLGYWLDGTDFLVGNHLVVPQGIASTEWHSGMITLGQWSYLYTTINQGKRSNFVTIRTHQYIPGTYYDCNAVLTLDPPRSLTKGVNEFTPFIWKFTNVQIIEEVE